MGGYASDPMKEIHSETLNRYYGTTGHVQFRNAGQTGAGHPDDEGDEGDWEEDDQDNNRGIDDVEEDLQNRISEDQAAHIRHAPIKVARHANPFHLPMHEDQFYIILDDVRRNGLIPEGYGVLECEWEDVAYPETEAINLGSRGKQIVVELPKVIWLSRAISFVQGLDVMTCLISIHENSDVDNV